MAQGVKGTCDYKQDMRYSVRFKSYRKSDRNLRLRVLKVLGSVCSRCGFSDSRALQVDHKNGGPGGHNTYQEKADGIGTRSRYLRILRDVAYRALFQILCANCNWIKRWERHEFPKEKY